MRFKERFLLDLEVGRGGRGAGKGGLNIRRYTR